MQYTIRQVPKAVDKALRVKAKREKKSLNEAALEALKTGLGVADGPSKKVRDLSDIVGTLTAEDARAINDAVAWMDEADLKSQREGER